MLVKLLVLKKTLFGEMSAEEQDQPEVDERDPERRLLEEALQASSSGGSARPERRARRRAREVAIVVTFRSPEHGRDHRRDIGLPLAEARDHTSMPEHDDAVREPDHVRHVVRDDEHSEAPVGGAPNRVENDLGLAGAESRGRLVHQEHARRPLHRSRDRDGLTLAAREVAHADPGSRAR